MISAEQARMARAALGWTQEEAAEKAGMAKRTLQAAEGTEKGNPTARTMNKIRRCYENAGIIFLGENGGGEGIRFTKRRAEREILKPAGDV